MFGGLKKIPYFCTTNTELRVQIYKNVSDKPNKISKNYE